MWDIKYLIKEWWRSKSFQEFINNRYRSTTEVVISKKLFKIVGTEYGLFYLNEHWSSIPQIEEYSTEDMLPSDIVLDIGAHIGAFSIKASRKCSHVYAVEPLFDEIINKNIALNNIKNITVLKAALGSGYLDIVYEGEQIGTVGSSLKELIDMCGGKIDFLKCDCEGGEWSITPEELKGIRQIEAEYHILKIKNKEQTVKPILQILDKAGFKYRIDNKRKYPVINIIETGLIHATNKLCDEI